MVMVVVKKEEENKQFKGENTTCRGFLWLSRFDSYPGLWTCCSPENIATRHILNITLCEGVPFPRVRLRLQLQHSRLQPLPLKQTMLAFGI